MQCLTEVLGLSLPGMSTVHAVDSEKMRLARESGRAVVRLTEQGIDATAFFTERSFRNAIKALMALGGSTNAVLHLLAIAHEAGVPLALDDFQSNGATDASASDRPKRGSRTGEIGEGASPSKIPTICGVIPNGYYSMLDFHRAGGTPAVLKRIEEWLDLGTGCVNGETLKENLRGIEVFDEEVIRPLDNPYFADSAIAILYGNLAPAGAVVKQSAVREDMLVHSGPARIFNSEVEARKGIEAGRVRDGDVVVVRYEGPRGGPGMRELLGLTRHLVYSGKANHVSLITDGRFSGFTNGPAIGHVCPEAQDGGPIALLQDGDRITIDIPGRKLEVHVDDGILAQRRSNWSPIDRPLTGYLSRYRRMVRPASEGAWLGLED
jgi:dihydroxy-acid dehydratase